LTYRWNLGSDFIRLISLSKHENVLILLLLSIIIIHLLSCVPRYNWVLLRIHSTGRIIRVLNIVRWNLSSHITWEWGKVRILLIIVVVHQTSFKRGFLKIYVFDKLFQNIWKSRRIRRKITESFSVNKLLDILIFYSYYSISV